MNDKPNADPVKTNYYWGIYSLILGIISIALPFIVVRFFSGHGSGYAYREYLWGMIIVIACVIFGAILGIKGLKTTRRKIAILGLVVCGIGLLVWFVYFGTWLIWVLFWS